MISSEGFDFSFDPSHCNSCGGKCCLGESGFVWIDEEEIVALANHLDTTVSKLHKQYLIREQNRYSLREVRLDNGGYACIFFDFETKGCSIYDFRPEQCRTFPFWDEYYVIRDHTFYECPGIVFDGGKGATTYMNTVDGDEPWNFH